MVCTIGSHFYKLAEFFYTALALSYCNFCGLTPLIYLILSLLLLMEALSKVVEDEDSCFWCSYF